MTHNRPGNLVVAWLVHLYTASGICFGFLALKSLSLFNYRVAMIWLLICLFVDSTDGILARSFKVKKALPWLNGKRMDTLVDFIAYALIPAYFIGQADLVPGKFTLHIVFFILLISLFYYGKEGMTEGEKVFVGFPVLWNLIVLYLFFIFSFHPWVNMILIMVFGVLHFVPIRIPYPSRGIKEQAISFAVMIFLLLDFLIIVWKYPETVDWARLIAIGGAMYFGILTIVYSFRSHKP
jgi:phosphatidylcholine synthase